ncbi:MAG: efflux RND transporter periplasmic adaptor subunit [Cytophagales bacterium]|nr:efflux RND transporter periplasmic adaptor subunit [Cytophagales bacterium]
MNFSQFPKWAKWGIALIALAVLVIVIGKGMAKRKAEQAAIVAAALDKKVNSAIELAPSDTVIAKTIVLSSGLPISGSIKAASSAVVKAKVAGDLHGLTVREGDFVKAGQLLATIDTTEFAARQNQAQKTADAARAQVDIAQKNVDNNKSLVEQNFISKTALETSLATLNGAKASYAAALAGVDVAKKSFDDAKVFAPISGTISVRSTQPGERVGIDARIVEIIDLSHLELEAALAPADSVSVRVGQAAQLTIAGAASSVPARVVRINPAATAGSRSVLIYLALDSVAGLRQGLFAQGTLATNQIEAIAVPITAIRSDKPAPYVQVVENHKVVHKNVTLGAKGSANGAEYIAVQGLLENAVVLQGNVGAVREGVNVTTTATTATTKAKAN